MSVSRLRAWQRCARYHYYRYDLGYRPAKQSASALFGTLMHEMLEAWWRAWRAGDIGDEALAVALHALHRRAPSDLDAYVRVQLEVLMVGYHTRWAPLMGAMGSIEVLDVERKFHGELVEGAMPVVGKIDAVCRRGGDVYLVEHKTTSGDLSAGGGYWATLRMDPQVSLYFAGARMLGYEPVGCVYDVIKKPTIRPHKAAKKLKYRKDGQLRAGQRTADETPEAYRERLSADIAEKPDRYFQRADVVRLAHELDEARREVEAAIHMITAHSFLCQPRNTSACFRYGAPCEFFDVCSGAGQLEDDPRLVRINQRKEKAA
jgi:hypothetical protein